MSSSIRRAWRLVNVLKNLYRLTPCSAINPGHGHSSNWSGRVVGRPSQDPTWTSQPVSLFGRRGLHILIRSLTHDQTSTDLPAGNAALASVIAIDGPAATGKTTVGLRLARELGYRLVDTGMMYRAVTWLALNRDIDPGDEAAVIVLAQTAVIELLQPDANGTPRLKIDGIDITDELRAPDVDRNVSLVSRVPEVREAMVRRQRELASEGRLIMLGRDIGSVVLIDAPVKIYLDASAAERARRRHLELKEDGVDRPEQEIYDELVSRDEMDRNRHASPLRPADDAQIINTDRLTLDEVVEQVRKAAVGSS